MNCPSCNHKNANGINFCAQCGHQFQSSHISCPSCHQQNVSSANFCVHCRHPLRDQGNLEGYIRDGKWYRAPQEIVRKVGEDELKKAFAFLGTLSSQSLEIPLGSICAVVENGIVVDVLPPGRQTTKKWFESFFAHFEQSKAVAQLYLISRQSIGFPVSLSIQSTTQAGASQNSFRALVTGNVGHTFTDPKRITTFLNRFVGEKDALSLQELQHQIHPQIEAIVKNTAQGNNSNIKQITNQIVASLRNELFSQTGLEFDVRITPTGSTQTISFHFGLVEVPSSVICSSCTREIQRGGRFCIYCKAPQTMRPAPSTKAEELALVTNDGQHIELDTSFVIHGSDPLYSCESFARSLAETIAHKLRNHSFDDIKTKAGMAELEQAGKEALEGILQGYQVLRFTILDLRSKKEEWLFRTKADIEQVRLELEATKTWLSVGAEEQDVEREVQEFMASRAQNERELELLRVCAELEHARNKASVSQEHKSKQEEQQLSAAEASFVLEQRRKALETKKAELANNENLQAQKRAHVLAQELALLNQNARIRTLEQDTAYKRLLHTAQQEEIAQREAFQRQQEKVNLGHTQSMGASTAQHNINIAAQQGAHNRKENLANAQTAAEIAALQQETQMSGLRGQAQLAEEQKAADQKRKIELREQDRLDAQQEAGNAMGFQSSKQDHELNIIAARQKVMEALKGQSVAEIMALAAVGAGRSLTDAESAAIAKIESGEDAAKAELLADFVQKNGAEKQQLLQYFEKIVSNMADATASAAAGGKVQEAYKDTAKFATDIAVGSSNVVCPSCKSTNPVGAKFCQSCGKDF